MGREHKDRSFLRRIRDINVGSYGMGGFTVLRVYETTEKDVTPELYVQLINKENSPSGGGLRSTYAGSQYAEHINATPLALIDVSDLYSALVESKSELARRQAAYKEKHREIHDAMIRGITTPRQNAPSISSKEALETKIKW